VRRLISWDKTLRSRAWNDVTESGEHFAADRAQFYSNKIERHDKEFVNLFFII
jgi:hypothetical protein